MAEYTIRDLMAISKTTDRAIRQLFDERKGNRDLINLKSEHIIRRQNRVFYDEVIYNWFLEYYKRKNSLLVENGEAAADTEITISNHPQLTPPPLTYTKEIKTTENATNDKTLADLKAYIKQLEDDILDTEEEYEETQRENETIKAELQAKDGIIEGLRQANESLTDTNAALRAQFAELTDRIAAQERVIDGQRQQIERLIVSNNALSITVNRAQQERLLTEAKKPSLLQRIKNRLLGQKPAIIAEETPEAVEVEPEADTKEAEEQ